jgi:Flp pilus assembly pilin Flp
VRFANRDDNALGKAIEYAITATIVAIVIGSVLTLINGN